MKHEQFKTKYIGKLFDYDGIAGSQCADVAKAYVEEVHGKRARAFGSYPTEEGGVINAFYNYPNCFIYGEDYELIENNPNDYDQLPQQGDIIIWGDYELTNQWGHIAVVDSANKNGFSSIDQNWNAGAGKHTQIVAHNYRGILGWLRLRGLKNNEAEIIAQVEAVKAEPVVTFTVTDKTPGISFVLRGLGSSVFAERWAWETVGAANGYRPSDFDSYNRNLKVGQVVRVPVRLLPPIPESTHTESTPVVDPIQEMPIVGDIDAPKSEPLPEVTKPITPQTTSGSENGLATPKQPLNVVLPREPLPIYMRTIYDSLRNGSYSVGAFVFANGGQEIIVDLLEGQIDQDAMLKAGLGLALIFLGYVQEQMKQKRKSLEK